MPGRRITESESETNVKKYVKYSILIVLISMTTMQVAVGEWLLICLVLVMAWEKRGEEKAKPSRGEKPFSPPSTVALTS